MESGNIKLFSTFILAIFHWILNSSISKIFFAIGGKGLILLFCLEYKCSVDTGDYFYIPSVPLFSKCKVFSKLFLLILLKNLLKNFIYGKCCELNKKVVTSFKMLLYICVPFRAKKIKRHQPYPFYVQPVFSSR